MNLLSSFAQFSTRLNESCEMMNFDVNYLYRMSYKKSQKHTLLNYASLLVKFAPFRSSEKGMQ